MRIKAVINGEPVETDVNATTSLLELLRSRGLTGAKEGCRIGVCGVCTVMVEGLPVSSCLYLAPAADGAEIWTVEGIAEREPALIDAFVNCEGMQCGICTPGQVMAAAAAPAADLHGEAEIRHYLEGNLCRCTGYASIVEAVRTYIER